MTNNPDEKSEKQEANRKQELTTDPRSENGQVSLGSLVSRQEKSLPKFEQVDDLKAILPATDINRYIGKGLTPELGRVLSGQKPNPSLQDQPPEEFRASQSIQKPHAEEFKFAGTKDTNDMPNLSRGDRFGTASQPFLQARKAEYAKPAEKQISEYKVAVDNFLKNTVHTDDGTLTIGEIQSLDETRKSIESANSVESLLSNTLHLARLYQHLRYIEEAKQAVDFSLGINPNHILGKQIFNELERMHPTETAATSFAPYSVSPNLTKAALRKRIKALSGGRVVVVGDLLIDELLEGKPERISREAPVLILEHVDTELIPGGAANTAHNITALGGICHAIGVCGDDEYADKLGRLLEGCGISHSLVKDPTRPTTVKTRILSKSHSLMQQLLRLDRISHAPLSEAITKQLLTKVRNSTTGYKAIILSDYKSGVVSDEIISACREESKKTKILVIVDAQGDFSRFKEVTLMTPNQPDTESAVGFKLNTREDVKRAGEQILRDTNATSLLVTRGAEGMVLFEKGKEMVELPVFNRSDVFDVTGAGDTVVATMALALVSGASFVEAMALGNLAAGIVVRKSGTAVTSQKEMIENLERLNIPD